MDAESGNIIVKIDPRYYRPPKVDSLSGDPSKAKKELGWQHTVSFDDLVSEMVREDIKSIQKN